MLHGASNDGADTKSLPDGYQADTFQKLEARVYKNPPISFSKEFDEFWQHVPRKEAKADARRAFDRILGRELATVEQIMAGVLRWKANSVGQQTKYIPQPPKWLNGHRWEDGPQPSIVADQRPQAGDLDFSHQVIGGMND